MMRRLVQPSKLVYLGKYQHSIPLSSYNNNASGRPLFGNMRKPLSSSESIKSLGGTQLMIRDLSLTTRVVLKNANANANASSREFGPCNGTRPFSTSPFLASRHANIGNLNVEIKENFAHLLYRPLPSSILSDNVELRFELNRGVDEGNKPGNLGSGIHQLGFFGIPTIRGKFLYNLSWRIIFGIVKLYINATNHNGIDSRVDISSFHNTKIHKHSLAANTDSMGEKIKAERLEKDWQEKPDLVASLELAILDYRIENPPKNSDSSSSASLPSSYDKFTPLTQTSEHVSYSQEENLQNSDREAHAVQAAKHNSHHDHRPTRLYTNNHDHSNNGVTRIIVKWRTEYNWKPIIRPSAQEDDESLTNHSSKTSSSKSNYESSSFATHSLPKNAVSGIFIFELDKDCRYIERHIVRNVEKISIKETETELTMGEFGLHSMAFNAVSLTLMERLSRVLFFQKPDKSGKKK